MSEGDRSGRPTENGFHRPVSESVEDLTWRNKMHSQMGYHKIKSQAQQLKQDLQQAFIQELDSLVDGFIEEVEQVEEGEGLSNNVSFSDLHSSKKKRKDGELPDKVFMPRNSVLTDLFKVKDVKTIYHIFVAILIVFSLNTVVYDLINEGRLNLSFDLIQFGMGKFSKVMEMWVLMNLSTLLVVYPIFYYWSTNRKPGKISGYDITAACVYIAYQLVFLVWPVHYIRDKGLPPGSSIIVTSEQIRLMMKVHAFVRENAAKVLMYKKDDSAEENGCPDFSKYLYFLFIPTLVYRDSYPRTQKIRWSYVVSNLGQVLACLFFTYYIFERFLVPVFRNFGREHLTARAVILSVFGSMLPATLVLVLAFFAILHSWFNAFAEMLTFADRMFYKDWWNSTSFANYYRTWNIVVHDWLYTYVYKDASRLFPNNRSLAMAFVFMISAVAHEYVLVMCFRFFYPVLFVMFMGAGFGFIFFKGVGRGWNVFLWLMLIMGNGMLMCLYSMEWYARQRCPENMDNFMDYLIPRSWTCDFEAMES
ncbi:sterol O-acyltransferase 1-like isoform X2 [Ostrea edulis]|uniref:sterol O-acyltransferase 1-like isoform X2 n=1 Tax=Ostrea edulis TaxID=37623 RepID=UPI0024AF1D1D|nr:sterol O-acyltransferase 1-like isoform X2 [Ostrea edulis]